MRHLVFERVGRLSFREAATPVITAPEQALVTPLAVARCDLDAAIVHGRAPFRSRALHALRSVVPRLFRSLPFGGPFPFGHECVAEVLSVGEQVRSVAPGDRVVVPFQISCGRCDRCRRGVTASCTGVPHAASFGLGRGDWGSVMADVVRVPFADAMLVRAPDVSPVELASAGDNVADGHRTVAPFLAARPGAPVLVVGGEAMSVGLYAALCAIALGSEQVDYLDPDPIRCAIAERLGARVVATRYRKQPRDYPITVDASAHPDGLAAAVLSTEPAGDCTSVGIYFATRTPFPLLPAFMNGIHFHTSRVCSRAELPAVLALIESGRLVPSRITTLLAPFDEAPEAFLHRGPKVVLTRDKR
jgi:threonine dehydrogenase-like Zn-dependent dehydrogenase